MAQPNDPCALRMRQLLDENERLKREIRMLKGEIDDANNEIDVLLEQLNDA